MKKIWLFTLLIAMALMTGCSQPGVEQPLPDDGQQQEQPAPEQPAAEEPEPGEPAAGDPFAVLAPNGSIALMDWDDSVDPEAILGEPLSDEREVLGPGSDTFMGSTIKTLVYEGITLKMMSPKDNGKTFYVLGMLVTGADFETAAGIRPGAPAGAVFTAYTELQLIEGNKENGKLRYADDSMQNTIVFAIKEGIVQSIEYGYILQ